MITFIVNGIDLSKYVQRTPSEAVRRVTGSNSGYMLDGSRREDYIATKYDPTFACKPLKRDDMDALLAAFESENVKLTYTSARKSTLQLIDSSSNVLNKYIMDDGTIGSDTVSNYTALIPVIAGQKYTFSGEGVSGYAYTKRVVGYDAGGNFVQLLGKQQVPNTGGAYSIAVTIPTGVAAVRLSYQQADTDTAFLAEARTILAIPSPSTVRLLMWLLTSATPIYGELDLSFAESKEVAP